VLAPLRLRLRTAAREARRLRPVAPRLAPLAPLARAAAGRAPPHGGCVTALLA
jgi:hypothetical protein